MSKYDSSQVNVGSLINPTEGLSRSLLGLSEMYGRQAGRKQRADVLDRNFREKQRQSDLAQKNIDASVLESKNRWNTQQQQHKDKLALDKSVRDSNADANKYMAGIADGTFKFKLDDYASGQSDVYKKGYKNLENRESSTRKFLTGGNSPEDFNSAVKSFEDSINPRSVGETGIKDLVDTRKRNLLALKSELDHVQDPETRTALLNKRMSELYGAERDELDRAVSSGEALTQKQKTIAYTKNAPKSVLDHANYANLYKSISGLSTGNTAAELLSLDRENIKASNNAVKSEYENRARAVMAGNKKLSESGKKGYGKVMEILATTEQNYGGWDANDVKAFVSTMKKDGVDDASIAMAIQLGSTDDEWFGIGKHFPSRDSDEFAKLHKFAKSISANKTADGGYRKLPDMPAMKQARSLQDIQIGEATKSVRSVPRSILNVLDKYKEKRAVPTNPAPAINTPAVSAPVKQENVAIPSTVLDRGNIPAVAPEKSVDENGVTYKSVNEDVPSGRDILQSKPKKVYNHKKFDSVLSNAEAGMKKGVKFNELTEDEQSVIAYDNEKIVNKLSGKSSDLPMTNSQIDQRLKLMGVDDELAEKAANQGNVLYGKLTQQEKDKIIKKLSGLGKNKVEVEGSALEDLYRKGIDFLSDDKRPSTFLPFATATKYVNEGVKNISEAEKRRRKILQSSQEFKNSRIP